MARRSGEGRAIALALVLVPILAFGTAQVAQIAGTKRLFPDLKSETQVARIEIARGREQVVLVRRADTGQWEILSAADAPGDDRRIIAFIERMRALRGAPARTAPSPREPLEVRLTNAAGEALAHAGFWTGEAIRRSDGQRLTLQQTPAIPLWPSAWSSLKPPPFAPTDIRQVDRLTADGLAPATPQSGADISRILASLSSIGFVAGSSLRWQQANSYRVQLADGREIDVQIVRAEDGARYVRLTADADPAIRALRRYAFRVPLAPQTYPQATQTSVAPRPKS